MTEKNIIVYKKLISKNCNFNYSLSEKEIEQVADFIVRFIHKDEDIVDIILVRYKGRVTYLLLTQKRLACLKYLSYSQAIRCEFDFQNLATKIIAFDNGLTIYNNNSENRVYFIVNNATIKHFIDEKLSCLFILEKKGGGFSKMIYGNLNIKHLDSYGFVFPFLY